MMTAPSELKMVTTESEYKPDWADSRTQAEIAAEVDREMVDELEEDSEDEYFGDRYGMLDFERQFDSEDENDVREAVQHGFSLGKWMDGLVDVLLKLDEDEEQDLEIGLPKEVVIEDPPVKSDTSVESECLIEAPLERPQGVWDDVRWFGRVIARTLGS